MTPLDRLSVPALLITSVRAAQIALALQDEAIAGHPGRIGCLPPRDRGEEDSLLRSA